ncbi:MAG: hypothetical protein HQL52_12300 [Magnetococcales bacterium]|nr:hypothetical protein [Magnetococcales bacterium]
MATEKSDISQPQIQEINDLALRLETHFTQTNTATFDPADLFGTPYGILVKKIWYRNKYLAVLPALPLLLVDFLLPGLKRLFVKKRQHAICLAHWGLGCLNLAEVHPERKDEFLEKAKSCLKTINDLAVETPNGLGWGIHLNWQTIDGLIPANTPCHTQTAYVFELLDRLNKIEPSSEYDALLAKIVQHTAHDYRQVDLPTVDGPITGYSIVDERTVVNSQSYRAMILIRGYQLLRDPLLLNHFNPSLDFVLQSQNPDGSWPYAVKESFIDCYHTCFVLKNLFKIEKNLKALGTDHHLPEDLLDRVQTALQTGTAFFNNFLLKDGLPTPFALRHRPVSYLWDSYDIAESVNLLNLQQDDRTIGQILKLFQTRLITREGLLRFRYYPTISRLVEGATYIRHANTAFFLALTYILRRHANDGKRD